MCYKTSILVREDVCNDPSELHTFVKNNSKPRYLLKSAQSPCDIGRDGGVSSHDYVVPNHRVDINLFADAVVFIDSEQPRIYMSYPSLLAFPKRY